MPFPRTPQGHELDHESTSQPRNDDAPTDPSHANKLTRIQILTGGYIAKHPTLLTVLEGLGWNNPGGGINP